EGLVVKRLDDGRAKIGGFGHALGCGTPTGLPGASSRATFSGVLARLSREGTERQRRSGADFMRLSLKRPVLAAQAMMSGVRKSSKIAIWSFNRSFRFFSRAICN